MKIKGRWGKALPRLLLVRGDVLYAGAGAGVVRDVHHAVDEEERIAVRQHGPYVVYVERFHAPIIPARGGISQEACAAGARGQKQEGLAPALLLSGASTFSGVKYNKAGKNI